MSAHPPVSAGDSLVEAVPDFIAFVRRDGVVLRHLGGRRVLPEGARSATGRGLGAIWPEPVGGQLRVALRRALADRGSAEVTFLLQGHRYDARFTARGPDRALCVIRDAGEVRTEAAADGVRSTDKSRREFHSTLQAAVADATLQERPLAVALVHLDGLDEVGRVIDPSVGRQLSSALLARAAHAASDWTVGLYGETGLAFIAPGVADEAALTDRCAAMLRALAEPVDVGDARFAVAPSMGVSRLGHDGHGARELVEYAREALLDARRAEDPRLRFYSSGVDIGAVASLDFERELREAIAADRLSLRYALRAELDTGRPVAACAYLRWPQALRRELRAADFLPIAESTGLARELSRWALGRLRRDLPALAATMPAGLRWSFGALRQHVAHEALHDDIEDWLGTGSLRAEQIELRIAERTISALPSPGKALRRFAERGIALVVDEFGRGYSSLPRLARLPLAGLQVDRALVTGARDDEVALRATRAALMLAAALDMMPIAAGVDDEGDRQRIRELGGVQGLGDLFGHAQGFEQAGSSRRSHG
jgi:predicted signal transduction protein with EAL and GGDEF domain